MAGMNNVQGGRSYETAARRWLSDVVTTAEAVNTLREVARGIVENCMRWLLILWLTAWALFSLPWVSFTSTPHWEHVRPPRVRMASRIRLDHVLNVAFYWPAAPLASALGYPLSAAVATGATLSVVAEGIQVFSTDRAPDGNDVIANLAGTLAGAVSVVAYRRSRSPRPPA